MSSTIALQNKKSLWWMQPAWLVTCFIIPIYMIIIPFSQDGKSPMITVRGIWFINNYYYALGLGLLIALSIGNWFGRKFYPSKINDATELDFSPALWTLGVICFLAYIIWFKDVLFSPSTLIKAFTGGGKPNRNEIGTAVGITSLSNFVVPFFALYAYKSTSSQIKLPLPLRGLAWTLAFLTVFRVYIWSERLALIELVCATTVPTFIAIANSSFGKRHATLLNAIPFLAIPVLLLYFGVFEYFRSWQSDTYNGKTQFWEFAVGRLASYYITALNNGAGQLSTINWPTFQFENTLSWLHKAPLGVGDMFRNLVGIQQSLSGLQQSKAATFLASFGDPEFNNPSGLFVVVVDMGIPLAIIYFFVFGSVASRLYNGYLLNNLNSIIFYPIFFIATLEILRIPYLGDSRVFTACLGALLAKALIRKKTPSSRHFAYSSRSSPS